MTARILMIAEHTRIVLPTVKFQRPLLLQLPLLLPIPPPGVKGNQSASAANGIATAVVRDFPLGFFFAYP
jgi:hypothetical protein